MRISSYIPLQQSASWSGLNVEALIEITILNFVRHRRMTRFLLDLYSPLTEAAGFEMPKCDFGLEVVDDPDVHSACSGTVVLWQTYE